MDKKYVVTVPRPWIKDAKIDRPGEFSAAVGLPLVIGGVNVPPVTYGVWALLEMMDCDLVHPRKQSTGWGCAVAFYVAVNGPQAAPLVMRAVANGSHLDPDLRDNPDPLTIAAFELADRAQLDGDKVAQLEDWLYLGFTGFAMMPNKGNAAEWWFGVETLAGLVAALGAELNATPDELAWHTPLTLIGHVAAQKAKQNGAPGVARPKDPEDIALQLKLAKERAAAGKLHPWQEQYPETFRLCGHESEDEAYRLSVLYHEKLQAQLQNAKPIIGSEANPWQN